jgi:hypothetical protein
VSDNKAHQHFEGKDKMLKSKRKGNNSSKHYFDIPKV